MRSSSERIAPGYAERYHALQMKRVLGLFVYHPQKSCPLCGSTHVHRTKRGRILEFWVLLFLPFRPYRCGKCRQRFYGPKKFPQTGDPDELDEDAARKISSSSRHPESSRR
jgi:ribosomal protein L37AE/L43A